jgi:hypothetical protein
LLDQEIGGEKEHMSQLSFDRFNTASFHLVKNYVEKGFSPEEIVKVTNLPVDIVKYELEKIEKQRQQRRGQSLEGVNISGGFGHHAVFN